MYNDYNIKDKILKDVNASGKDNNWKERKKSTLDLADSYKRIGSNKYYRVLDCSTFLEFRLAVDNSLKLSNANFCKVRLCPMCSWRRSLKIFGQVSRVMDHVEENYNYKYIFLTLTVKNCYGEDLRDTLDLMTKAFNTMTRRKAFKQAVNGYFRSLEITYNKENDTYHPHFHMILAVDNSYFTQSRIYLSQNDWTELWKSCLKVDYTPIVDVRRIKENKEKDFGKVVAETAKYTVKPEDFLIRDEKGNIKENLTDEVVKTLDEALHRKRLTAFGFIFKEVHKELNLDDTEDGDLTNTDNEDLREDLTNIILRYQWNIGVKNYILVEVQQEDK
ncbi:MAG: protein rep [Anaerococcus sp.]|nr:protein rep [Anaerococcus sp.]